MTSNLLGISVTGLRAAQTALNTTGHNIANAGVEGYSRQRVLTETNPATIGGGGYIGNGTNVASIERVANEFISAQVRVDTTLNKDLDVYYGNISQLDTLLSDVSTGLAGGLESFFASMQNGADDPTSIPARQLIISEAENLADRFNTIYARIESIEKNVNSEMTSVVSQINALSQNIAGLNQKVADAMGTGGTPNDLIDQRDEAIRKLSELISVQTFDQGFGQVNVVVGSGSNLVIGSGFREIALTQSASDATKTDVIFLGNTNSQSGQVITNLISGGELGGLVRFRDTIMEDTYNQLGRVAVVMAETFNTTHRQGINLNDEFGGNFFYDVNDPQVSKSRAIGNSSNALPADRLLTLDIVDNSQLKASNYSVTIEAGGLFRITRESDGEEVGNGALSGSFPFEVSFDGLNLKFEGGTFQAGDQFKLQPFKSGAREFTSELLNAKDIAFGTPLVTDSSIGNIGSAVISPGEVLSLLDQNDLPLPLLATAGEMNPPLLVKFTTPTSYDILDNSDPGNPIQLDPPIRNQRYVVGGNNVLFSQNVGGTMVSTKGDMVGIPEGRRAVVNASMQFDSDVNTNFPTGFPPAFGVTDFSDPADEFSFEVAVSNSLNGANNGTFSVGISSAAIVDERTLLLEINNQLGSTDVRAYIADNGTLAFKLNSPGYGDITLQNYNGDPDSGGDIAPVGQANTLLGFDVEGLTGVTTFTTSASVDGISGDGLQTNGYPAEAITITAPSAIAGANPETENIFTNINANARETASLLNSIAGVSANAFNYMEISNLQLSGDEPLQFSLNGANLIPYGTNPVTGEPIIGSSVPDAFDNPDEFYDFLAEAINNSSTLADLSIHAVAGVDAVTGARELRIFEREGNDLELSFTAGSTESIDVSDGENPNIRLEATGNSTSTSITAGGKVDVSLDEGYTLSTFPRNSMLFGDSRTSGFAKSTFLGVQAEIQGAPEEGDTFSLGFNSDGASDNRNALAMANLESKRILDGGSSSYADSYGSLVEKIGIDTASSEINFEASEQVLQQSLERRNSVSGVNLDEEAANLIRFEQMFSANAQVISVARDLFERLISSF
ncbi:MAG: flagellar hook-associated protein 1 FlgK [Lentisphaeria bacterium]|jgi:flagellar hook-associated protein 1 FlgK